MDDGTWPEDAVPGEWEAGLPTADNLPPLSKSLIPPELASAFRIPPPPPKTAADVYREAQFTLFSPRPHPPNSDQDSEDARRPTTEDAGFTADEDQSTDNETLTNSRLVWTTDLHKRFVEAIRELGGPKKPCRRPSWRGCVGVEL